MNLADYDSEDGKKVWLSQRETDTLLSEAGGAEQRIALALGARCGLRSAEVVDVAPQDIVETDAGRMLRVWDGKGSKYRETPIPPNLATTIETVGDVRDEPEDAPVVDVSTRTLRRWVSSVAEKREEATGDRGWSFLGFHDLRRTWATSLRSADVDAMVVCDWGGWDDLETFLDHYRGTATPEAQLREREKVGWL